MKNTALIGNKLICPECLVQELSEVIDTRLSADGRTIRRRRECVNGHRFTTKEREEAEWSGWEI